MLMFSVRRAVVKSPLCTYGRRAFSDAGPTARNSLSEVMRDPESSGDSKGLVPLPLRVALRGER